MTDKIISAIRAKFIENLDEGLLLRKDIGSFKLSEEDRNFFKKTCSSSTVYNSSEREDMPLPDKSNPIKYLTTIMLKERQEKIKGNPPKLKNIAGKPYPYYENNFIAYNEDINSPEYFQTNFNKFWGQKTETLKAILYKAPEYVSAENIIDSDITFVNVGNRSWERENPNNNNSRANDTFFVYNNNKKYSFVRKADCKQIVKTYADLFIFTSKYFIKLSLGSDGLIDRREHIIQKDIKNLNIVDNNLLEIYFHGHFDPETIVLDDSKSTMQLQRHLTDLRQIRNDSKQEQQKK